VGGSAVPIPGAGPSPTLEKAALQPYACTTCVQRKVRCDKQQPCLSCVRSGLTCRYRSTPPPPRRKRKLVGEYTDQDKLIDSLVCLLWSLSRRPQSGLARSCQSPGGNFTACWPSSGSIS
jgi:hypothetical protein